MLNDYRKRSQMKLSKAGTEALVIREGLREKAYKDTKGIWTVGVGDIDLNNDGVRDVSPFTKLTREQAFYNFSKDVLWAEEVVNEVNSILTQNQFDALVSFVFNIGATAFAKSTMKKLLDVGKFEEAAKQFDRWVIPPEITSRRMSEKKQFLS